MVECMIAEHIHDLGYSQKEVGTYFLFCGGLYMVTTLTTGFVSVAVNYRL